MQNTGHPLPRVGGLRATLRTLTLAAITLGTAAGLTAPVAAQAWPEGGKPIRIVVPFPPGGSTDAIGRLLASAMSDELKHNVIVENRGGANGNIGSNAVAQAPADGYTLLLSGIGSNAINYAMYDNMPYKDADFRHVSLLTSGPNVLAVNASFPAKNFQEFIQVVKEKPGTYSNASPGNGSSSHLSMELLKQMAGLDLVHVPYRGNGPAMIDVIGGQVPLMFVNNDVALPHVTAGKFRPLAVTSQKRNPAYPDVPTIAESGFPDFDVVSWFALSAPAGTPDAVVQRLAQATAKAMRDPKLRDTLEASGFVVDPQGPDDTARFIENEIQRWSDVVQRAGISAQ